MKTNREKIIFYVRITVIGISMMFMSAFMASCKTQKALVQERVDSIYIEKLIPYALPTDSASVRALMECDENGKVVLRWLDMANTKNVDLQFSLDSMGNMKTGMKVVRDTLYLPSKEKYVYKDKLVQEFVPVEKELNWWQRLRIWLGNVALVLGICWLAWVLIKRMF